MKQFLLFLLLFGVLSGYGQVPAQLWSKTYGGTKNESISYTMPTSDGRFLVLGTTRSTDGDVPPFTGTPVLNRSYLWAMLLNADGTIFNKKVYRTSYEAYLSKSIVAQEVADGYVIAFYGEAEAGKKNARFKVSKSDLSVVVTSIEVSFGEGSSCIALRHEGGYLLGSPEYITPTKAQFQTLRADLTHITTYKNLHPLWGRRLQRIIPITGGYLLFGETEPAEQGCFETEVFHRSNAWVCKLSTTFAVEWSKEFGGTTADIFGDAEVKANGNILLLGITNCSSTTNTTGPSNVGQGSWMIELDTSGVVQRTFSLSSYGDVSGFSLLPSCPNDIVLCGRKTLLGRTFGFVNKIRISGQTSTSVWEKLYDGNDWDKYYAPNDVRQTADGKFLVWGNYASSGNLDGNVTVFDYWITLLDKDGACATSGSPCVNAQNVFCGVPVNGTTIGAPNNGKAVNYTCADPGTTTYNGPDKAYRFTYEGPPVNLKVALEIISPNVNLDVFLFRENCALGCIEASTADNVNVGSFKKEILEQAIESGTYYIVIDGYNESQQGNFKLSLECGCACACVEPEDDEPGGQKLFGENFDGLQAGNLDPQSSRWLLWKTSTPSAVDAQVLTETGGNKVLRAANGTNIIYKTIVERLAEPENPPYLYRLSWRLFVENGKSAFYSLLNALPDKNGNNAKTAYGVSFNTNGTISIQHNAGTTTGFSYQQGVWNQVMQVVDLNVDSAELWVNGQFLYKFEFSPGANPLALRGIDFSAQGTTNAFKVDDICMWERASWCESLFGSPSKVFCTPSGKFFPDEHIARCALYTSQEFNVCANICDIGGLTLQRGDPYSGSVGPAQGPIVSLQESCVKSAYNGSIPPGYFSEVLAFYNERKGPININLTKSNPQTKSFVFRCFCKDPPVNNPIYGINNFNFVISNTADNNCPQACLGDLASFNSGPGLDAEEGFYYILILSPVEDNYTIKITPPGICGSNITPLYCNTPVSGTLSGEDTTFSSKSLVYRKIYNGLRPYTGRDKIYRFLIERPSTARIKLSSSGPMGFFLFSDICGGNPVDFAETPPFGGNAELSLFFSPGIYYLSVDEGTLNAASNFTLTLDQCIPQDPSVTPSGIFYVEDCPIDSLNSHEVNIPATATDLNVNDFIRFIYDDNGQPTTNSSMGRYWAGGPVTPFKLPKDVADGPLKCSYAVGDPFVIQVLRYDNGSSRNVNYDVTFQGSNPTLGITASNTFVSKGKSAVSKLIPIAASNYLHVNPVNLSPSFRLDTLKINIKGNYDWVIEEQVDEPWIRILNPQGSNNETVSIEFKPNTTAKSRNATLRARVPAIQNYAQFIQVKQRAECKTPTVTISGLTSPVCSGTTVNLTANPGPNNLADYPYYSYKWSDGSTGQKFTVKAPTVQTQTSYTYALTVTDENCNAATQTAALLTVAPQPTVEAGSSLSICGSAPVQLNGQIMPLGTNAAVRWSHGGAGGTFGSSSSLITTYTPPANKTSITLTLSTLQGVCAPSTDNLTLTIKVKPNKPTLLPTANLNFCEGNVPDAVTVTAPAGASVVWFNSSGSTIPTAGNGTTFSPPGAGIFSAEAQLNGCKSDRTSVEIKQKLAVKVDAGPLKLPGVCAGQTVPLSGSITGGVTTGSWTSSPVGTFANAQSPITTFTPPNGATSVMLTLRSTAVAGCKAVEDQTSVDIGARVETCNNVDDDCDGAIDETGVWKNATLPLPVNKIGDKMGTSIARNGSWAVVGAPEWDASTTKPNVGRAFVYERTNTNPETWTLRKILTSPSSLTNDRFGFRVSIEGDFIAVGTPRSNKSGEVYLFSRNQGTNQWGYLKKLSGSTSTTTADNFGSAVCLHNNYLFVGADSVNMVYVYQRNADGSNLWGKVGTLIGKTNSLFGNSVAVDGDRAVIGARNMTKGNTSTTVGAAFVYERASANNWVFKTTLQPSILESADRMGESVAISGDVILVGAPFHDDDNGSALSSDFGAAFLYERDLSGKWIERLKLKSSVLARKVGDRFGTAVALGFNYAAVGAELEDNTKGVNAGSVYLFHRDEGGSKKWGEIGRLYAPDAIQNHSFGFGNSISLTNNSLLVGAAAFDSSSVIDKGKVYFFKSGCIAFGQEQAPDIAARESEETNPQGLRLHCRPVPFSDILTIETGQIEQGYGRIEIRDILGNRVALVFEGQMDTASTFTWDAPSVPAGTYYVLFETAAGKVVKPVVYLR